MTRYNSIISTLSVSLMPNPRLGVIFVKLLNLPLQTHHFVKEPLMYANTICHHKNDPPFTLPSHILHPWVNLDRHREIPLHRHLHRLHWAHWPQTLGHVPVCIKMELKYYSLEDPLV